MTSTRAVVLASLLATGLVTGLASAATGGGASAEPEPEPESATGPVTQELGAPYRFVSAPDLLNSDIGDVSGTPGYRPGDPNSTNADVETALDVVHDTIAGEDPDDVLVAGDMVEGHWTSDQSGADYFGVPDGAPLIRAAGELYYAQWRERFTERGLDVHTAVGDHEIGDNPWRRGATPTQTSKWENVGVFKEAYAEQLVAPHGYTSHPTGQARDTAYATRLDEDVLLVTLDVFRRTADDVVAEVDDAQLRWLDGVLREAREDRVAWVVVQGHVPILKPVRQRSSSGLGYAGGQDSELWRTLRRHRVDLYLHGEVHDVTVKRQGGVTQVSHGGIFGPLTNYLVGSATEDRLELELRELTARRSGQPERLWGLDPRKTQPVGLEMGPARTTGRLVLGPQGRLVEADGRLVPGYAGD